MSQIPLVTTDAVCNAIIWRMTKRQFRVYLWYGMAHFKSNNSWGALFKSKKSERWGEFAEKASSHLSFLLKRHIDGLDKRYEVVEVENAYYPSTKGWMDLMVNDTQVRPQVILKEIEVDPNAKRVEKL